MIRKSLSLLDGKEFIEIIIPCLSEVVDRYSVLIPKPTRQTMTLRLGGLKQDKELSEIQRCELKRITDKLLLTVM